MLNKQAFTLVELIVVVTILAILATIGFVSYSGYLTGVRDTNRIASLTAISDGLELYRTKNDLPDPDDAIDIQIEGVDIAHQGYVGSNVLQTIEYSKAGKDPKDDSYYSYYLTDDKKHYQLMAFLEESDNLDTNIISHSNAATSYENRYPKVYGKKLGILTDSDNTPVQEIITGTLNFTGGTNTQYISRLNDIQRITGSGSKMLVLADIVSPIKDNPQSCRDNLSVKTAGLNKNYIINIGNNELSINCDMVKGKENRIYRKFDGINDYIQLPNLKANGNFELELEFSTTDTTNQILLGDDNRSTYYFNISNTSIIVQIANIEYVFNDSSINLQDGETHKINYKLEGTTLIVKVDGMVFSSPQTVTPYTGENNFRVGDSNYLKDYFSGVISNINFKSGWTYHNGVNPYYRLDDISYAAKNIVSILGEDQTPKNAGDWDMSTASISYSNSIFTLTNTIPHGNVMKSLPSAEIDDIMVITGDLIDTSPRSRLFIFGGNMINNLQWTYNDLGKFEIPLTVSGPNPSVFIRNNISDIGVILAIDNLHIQKAPGYGLYNSFEKSSIIEYK